MAKTQLSKHLVIVNGEIEFQSNDAGKAAFAAKDIADRLFHGGNTAAVYSLKGVDALRLGILNTDKIKTA